MFSNFLCWILQLECIVLQRGFNWYIVGFNCQPKEAQSELNIHKFSLCWNCDMMSVRSNFTCTRTEAAFRRGWGEKTRIVAVYWWHTHKHRSAFRQRERNQNLHHTTDIWWCSDWLWKQGVPLPFSPTWNCHSCLHTIARNVQKRFCFEPLMWYKLIRILLMPSVLRVSVTLWLWQTGTWLQAGLVVEAEAETLEQLGSKLMAIVWHRWWELLLCLNCQLRTQLLTLLKKWQRLEACHSNQWPS